MEQTAQQEILDSVFELDPKLLEPFNATETEQCGIILGHRSRGHYIIDKIVEVPNSHDDPSRSFAIKRKHMKEVLLRETGVMLGVLHTHWEGATYPSVADVNSIPQGWLGIVWHPPKKTITYYNRHGYISEVQL